LTYGSYGFGYFFLTMELEFLHCLDMDVLMQFFIKKIGTTLREETGEELN